MIKDFSGYKILVVDDIPANVLLLKMMLEQSGFGVLTAQGAEEAFSRLEEEQVDLILMDVLMPGVDGFELAKQLKEHSDYQEIPIIFLTALNTSTDVIKGFQLGGDDFISKPFNKEELLVRIRYQLNMLEAKRTIKRQTAELEKTIAGRDALYSVIAHDLRVPMSSMKMILNALAIKAKEQHGNEAELVDMLHSANEISEHLFVLLDNLLKWTSSQLGRLKAVPQSINLPELVEGIVEVSSIIAATKDIQLNFYPSSMTGMEVFVDIDMIKTSIRNLISNAIKFSYRGKEVDVVVKLKDGKAILEVIDHGCGISQENQAKLMNLSSHYTTFGTENESGSGLGLLLVSEFLKLNNGRVFFTSKEGEGSTFGFALPVQDFSANESPV
ncbi:Alkaline phosphatase synthesis transcriptional regulatory protein PhoP [Petrimonas mucosa]|uniref:histidine kinase n=2 Tax=Petrimonas mucosa TaxID=1642646 RepID=A0A1G4GAH4_9BACT|nr:Alkaline phosphatase synthesis transcriptional regulatory protein PhoP [Petrimonas mucosa]